MKRLQRRMLALVIIATTALVTWSTPGSAEEIGTAPAKIQAAIVVKLLALEKSISGGGDVSVFVIGSPEFAAEIRKAVGRPVGKSKLASVEEGDGLPASKPSAVFIGDETKLEEVMAYTRGNQVLSLTGVPDLVPKGVSVGVGVAAGKPKILLNLSASAEEGANWNPTILKISKTYK